MEMIPGLPVTGSRLALKVPFTTFVQPATTAGPFGKGFRSDSRTVTAYSAADGDLGVMQNLTNIQSDLSKEGFEQERVGGHARL